MMAGPGLVDLLAYLDFLVEGAIQRSLQDEDIEEYIYQILGKLADHFYNQYKAEEIRDLLWQEFGHGDAYPDHNFPRLFLHGSSEMPHLAPMTKSRSRLSRSIYPASGMTPRYNFRISSKPARQNTRSNSIKPRTTAVSKVASHKKRPGVKATRVSRGQGKKNTPLLSSIEIDETPVQSPCAAPSARNFGTPSFLAGEKPKEELTLTSEDSVSIQGRNVNYGSLRPTNSPRTTPNPTEAYLDLVSELTYYKDRCSRAEEECINLKKERRQMESSNALTKDVPNDALKVLFQDFRRVNNLKKKAQLHRDLEPYLCIGDANCGMSTVSTAEKVFPYFHAMKAQLSAIFVLKGAKEPQLANLYDDSDDLDFLMTTIFDASFESRTESISDNSPAFTFSELIQGLTGAAIHRWVFQSEYRSYVTTITPLLQKYREHIATLCGDERLCNLDTAAHQSLLGEKTFVETTIPRMGSALTKRFLNALQPLFDQCSKYDMSRKLKPILHDIFRLAIQIRSLCLIGTEDYESIWPLSGSSFERDEMETKHLGTSTVKNVVRLPICPGLRAYSKNKSMVQYCAFGARQGLESEPKYIVKASILV